MLFLFGVLMCVFRSNGLYAFLVLAVVFALVFWKKSFIIVFVPLLALVVAFVVKGPVYNKLGVSEPDTIESLSIPAQHISRAIIRGAELYFVNSWFTLSLSPYLSPLPYLYNLCSRRKIL